MSQETAPTDESRKSIIRVLSRYRFVILLFALFSLIIVVPLAELVGVKRFGYFTLSASLFAILLSSMFAVSRGLKTIAVAAFLIGTYAVLRIAEPFVGRFIDSTAIGVVENVVVVLFLFFTVILVLVHLFTSKEVTVDTISASLCVYLMIGILWALLYAILDVLEADQSFFYPDPASVMTSEPRMDVNGDMSGYALYFSLVTMTTLGYGDVGPLTPTARILSATQAVVGQMYLAVLVARLVGLHISQTTRKRSS